MNFKIILFCLSILGLLLMGSCGDSSFSCEDGKQNQGELGIDCGGPCPNCDYLRTCNDGIQNGGELGVDCGGTCPNVCSEIVITNTFFEATVNDMDWSALQVNGSTSNGTLTLSGLDANGLDNDYEIKLIYSEEFITRTGTLDMIANTASIGGTNIGGNCMAVSGSISFTKFDTTNRLISGTFEFTCQDAADIETTVTNGRFQDISY